MNATEYKGLKSILKKILITSYLVGLTIAIVLICIPLNDDNYYLALIEKHNILEQTSQPRIILAGGSNLPFGIDSDKMKNELNISIVNSGLHAGIGLNYMLNDLKPYLKDNDIIIIIPEYGTLQGGGDSESLAAMLNMNPGSITYLNQKDFLNIHIIGIWLFRLKVFDLSQAVLEKLNLINPNNTFSYPRYGFNENGDEVSHLKFKSNYTLVFDHIGHNIDYSKKIDDLIVLNEFDEYAIERNISVYFSFPPIEEEEYHMYQNDYQDYFDYLRNNLAIKIIGSPDMFKFPKKYFFDKPDHLNSEGRENRTEILISVIKENQIVENN